MTSALAVLGICAAGLWLYLTLDALPRAAPTEDAWRRRAERLPPAVGWLAVAVFLFVSIAAAQASLLAGRADDKSQFLRQVFGAHLLSGVLVVVLLLAMLRGRHDALQAVFARPTSWLRESFEAFAALFAWLPLVFVVHFLARMYYPQAPGKENLVEQALVQPHPWDVRTLAALAAVIRAPIVEELVFRGFLLTALARFGVWPAVAVSSLAFAAVHSAWPDPVPLAVVGMMFGTSYVRSGSLVAPIAGHAFYNGAMTVFALAAPR